MKTTKNLRKKSFGVFNTILLIVLSLYALSLILLLFWGASTSLKKLDDFYSNKIWLPSGRISAWGWENYPYVLQNFYVRSIDQLGRVIQTNILGQAINTVLYAVVGSFVTTFCCCIVSYCAAKFNFAFCKVLYPLVLVVMIIPIVGNTPSVLLLLKNTGLYDTWFGTYLMKFSFFGVYFLVFHGIYEGISSEYAEAATIDGANEYQIFFTIMLPIVKTTFYTIFMVHFIDYWNDYNTALMYMPTHPTLAYGVYYISNSADSGMSNAPSQMVSCVILALPLTIIFVAFRDKLLGNTTAGGVKE